MPLFSGICGVAADMFLLLILILLLAGIAFLWWWRDREEREWLMELAYMSRHEGREAEAEADSEVPPPQQPVRLNVTPRRTQQQIKLHYQKVQEELRQKIEQLNPTKKKLRRRVVENQEELPMFPAEAPEESETDTAVITPADVIPAGSLQVASPLSEHLPVPEPEPDLSHPNADLPVISIDEATRLQQADSEAEDATESASEELPVITLDEATRILQKTEAEEKAATQQELETVVLNWPPKPTAIPQPVREEITPDDPALQYVRGKLQTGWPPAGRSIPPVEAPASVAALAPTPTTAEATPRPTIGPDDIRSNLLRQQLASRRAQAAAATTPVPAPIPDLAVIEEDEILANLSKTDAPANRERSRFKRQTVRESVIPAAARISQSYSVKVPAEQPVSTPISSRFTPFEQRPEAYSHLTLMPAAETAAVETEAPVAAAQIHISDNPPWSITDRLLSESPPSSDEVLPPSPTQPTTPSFRPDLSLLSEAVPTEVPEIELGQDSEWQQALAEGAQSQWQAPAPAAAAAHGFSTQAAAYSPKASFADFGEYSLPVSELLLPPQYNSAAAMTDEQLIENGITIEEKLAEFKVKVKVVDAYAGPVITRYEIEPDVGVRGNSVINLEKDLARSLGVASIRVVETIPGKTCMGLELPNPTRQMIRLSEIFNSPAFEHSKSKLTLALGQDITGAPVVTDLARAPHLLVAGTTGSGKSVGVNSMILSMLFKATPEEVRLIMIDPKMLELSIYEGIPHLLAPVVTDMKLAANALTWCVNEMEKRYRLMSHIGVRNLAGYNQKIKEAAERGERLANPFSLTPDDPEPLEKLPFIVVVVDEFADLMMTTGKKIEELIARLAQKARAAGIHLILATQRPSVDVITGLIKANIPTRIAFQVSSKVDSRTSLDQLGAENLLGQGDMLFLPPGTGYPQRVHGAFVADEEVHGVVEYLKGFGEPDYVEDILTAGVGSDDLFSNANGSGYGSDEKDPLFDEAVAFVLRSQKATISSIQRHLRIGYNKAANLVDQMEAEGIVSAADSNGKRSILARADRLDDND